MKREFFNISLHRTLSASMCALLLSVCCASAVAQTETSDADMVTVKRIGKKQAKQYPMRTVTGVVTDDATGEPMSGVRVQALGLNRYSTLTGEDGSYTLEIPTFSYAVYMNVEGYNSLQVSVKDGKADAKMISEHFNTYYTDGTSITAQKTITLDETSGVTLEDEIEKKLAGDIHTVSRNGFTGQGLYMTIRGISSINANAQPLVVLDGNIVDMQYDRQSMHEGFFNNVLAGIDPENVETVQVLKNGTALYGAKGANGVIIITTKRGKSMATKINARAYVGFELQPKKLSVLNGNQYKNYLSDMVGTVKDVNVNTLSSFAFLDNSPNNYYRNVFSNNTDWQKDLYRTAMNQNFKLSVEGGDDIGMYALSLGYTKSEGTAKGDDMDRLNLRFNTDIKIASKLKTGLDISYNQNSYDVLDQGWSDDYSMQNVGSTNVLGLIMPSFISPYSYYLNEDLMGHVSKADVLTLSNEYAGKYASTNMYSMWNGCNWVANPFCFPHAIGAKDGGINEALRNPLWIIENGEGDTKNFAQNTQINLNVSPRYEVTKTFTISDRFNYNMNRNSEKYYLPINGSTPYELKDLGTITSILKTMFAKQTILHNDLRLDWRNTYGAHTINVFGGWRYSNYSYSYNYMRGYNNENDKLPILNRRMKYINYGGTNDNWIDMTYYLDANYNFKNRYFADFSLSSEASSRFGNNTKSGFHLGGVSWGLFPSLQLGWIISNEDWFHSRGVDYLKLTAGVEMNGNDNLDYYASRTYWESQNVTHNTVGLYLKNIENSQIQWETTTKYNVALNGSFLGNRLQAGLDLFWHKTSDLLTRRQLSYISGMKDYWTNDGELTNKGFEASINAVLLNRKNWKWEFGVTMGHYNNKITKLAESDRIEMKKYNWDKGAYETTHYINGYTNNVYGNNNVLTAEGYSTGSFYGWQTQVGPNGSIIFADDAEASHATDVTSDGYLKYPTGLADADKKFANFQAGDVRFVDQNGDGVIDDYDKVVIGNPNPDVFGNIFTSLTWKDLRLDVFFKYSLGNDIYNFQRSILEGLNTTYNQTLAATRRWSYMGQVTDMPKACYTNSEDWRNNERMSDRWIEDGSYLKMKNVRLTYKIPYRNSWLLGLKVWGEANNLFTITRYLGTDPEMSARNGLLYQGIDNGLIPHGRSFNMGVTINL